MSRVRSALVRKRQRDAGPEQGARAPRKAARARTLQRPEQTRTTSNTLNYRKTPNGQHTRASLAGTRRLAWPDSVSTPMLDAVVGGRSFSFSGRSSPAPTRPWALAAAGLRIQAAISRRRIFIQIQTGGLRALASRNRPNTKTIRAINFRPRWGRAWDLHCFPIQRPRLTGDRPRLSFEIRGGRY